MRLETEQVFIRRPEQHDVEELLDLRVRNREFVQPFEPLVPEVHFTAEGQREIVAKIHRNWEQGIGFGFGVFLKKDGRLSGRVNLSNVVRGAWESCTLGYFIDKEEGWISVRWIL